LKRLARKSALSYKASSENIVILNDVSFGQPKTKDFIELLNNLSLSNDKVLLVTASNDTNVYLSARNLPKAKVVSAESLNTYDIMNAGKLVLVEGSIEQIQNILN
jgi:large subunit ribosomal protein L4